MKVIIFSSLFLLLILFKQHEVSAAAHVVCYYGSWATYRPNLGKFDIEDINPKLCSHVIYTFVGLNEDASIKIIDPYNDLEENYGKGAYKRLQNLRDANPPLKTLIAIGGWNEGSAKYSKVMGNDELRAKFVQNAAAFVLKYNFNGLDFDWEYPNQRGGRQEDVQNFVKTLSQLRAEFDKHGLLLTAAVGSAEFSASLSYDIPQVSKYLDFIHVMTYDLHGPWDKIVGHNSPLYGSSKDVTDIQKQLNIDACIKYWLSKGANPSKIILGLATYGHSFQLNNSTNPGIGAPADNPGAEGPYTRQAGILGYNEVVELKKQGGWIEVFDEEQQVPHIYKNNQWIGFDDPNSIQLKVQYAKAKNLGGVMIWSLETDDFHGISGVKNPLLLAINSALGNNVPPEQGSTPKPDGGGNNYICQKEGYARDPIDCGKFYYCTPSGNGYISTEFHCGENLVFDLITLTCNYPENVDCSN